MPGQYVKTNNGHVQMRGHRMSVGGDVLLLNQERKIPIRGGELSTSNKIVGIITPQPAKPAIVGGEVLKNINFVSQSKKQDGDRIKFIF